MLKNTVFSPVPNNQDKGHLPIWKIYETENCLYTAASDEVLVERVFPCPIKNQIFQIKKFLEDEKKWQRKNPK